jgi:hypothetical protein
VRGTLATPPAITIHPELTCVPLSSRYAAKAVIAYSSITLLPDPTIVLFLARPPQISRVPRTDRKARTAEKDVTLPCPTLSNSHRHRRPALRTHTPVLCPSIFHRHLFSFKPPAHPFVNDPSYEDAEPESKLLRERVNTAMPRATPLSTNRWRTPAVVASCRAE